MKKFIIRFILLPCILALNINSNLYAHAFQGCSYASASSAIKIPLGHLSNNTKSINSFFFTSEQTFKLDIAEMEEDKLSSSKGYLNGINSFTILFPDQTPGHFFGYIRRSESLAGLFSVLTLTSSYLVFKVFRI
ncbi:MAG TPA: hypothetical protein PLJ60_11625 [Chryseolinea sp.]|nr:hypothetical protein [Chryseolinea sp.]